MNQPIEKELKILVTKEQLDQIIKSYDFSDSVTQTNTYFDTEEGTIRKQKGALRIRTIGCRNILTLKIRKDAVTHYEYEKEIDTDDIHAVSDPEIISWFQEFDIPQNVKQTASFTTIRRTFDFKEAQLCADVTNYAHHTDYELEYEYKYEHDGIFRFNQILEPLHLTYTKNCPSKIARAFD